MAYACFMRQPSLSKPDPGEQNANNVGFTAEDPRSAQVGLRLLARMIARRHVAQTSGKKGAMANKR